MPRPTKSKPAGLTIDSKVDYEKTKNEDSPPPKSSPMNLEGIDLSSFGGDIGPDFATLPPLPQSPPLQPPSPGHKRDPSRTFLTNFKTRISPEQEQREQRSQIRQVKDDNEYRPGSSSMSKIYHLRKDPGSTPELSLVGSAENVRKQSSEEVDEQVPERPQPSPHHSEEGLRRKEKGFRNPLTRSKSIRRDSNSKSRPNGKQSFDQPPKTAPLSSDWPGSSDMLFKKSKDRRGKSAERAVASESEEHLPLPHDRKHAKEKDKNVFVTGSKNVMSKAKSGGGNLFNRLGKIGRSHSNTEKEIPDSEYVFKVIMLPLTEQVRITRISKDLASCRDKTEYWMASLPWRCIDYLNLNCETEGLYRVPGSGPQVKHWQRRFDSELDVDLLDEDELYDPNNIASMLKSWLRELPTEIMPKKTQHELATKLAKDNPEYQKMGQPATKELRDTLSALPPFNYYLLFAITCHLSLMLQHQDKNKMDLNNLSICVGPCLDLERWLFNYLVGDWRNCWQGCYTEKDYLAAEKAYEQGQEYQVPTIRSRQQSAESALQNVALDDSSNRAVQSSSSAGSRNASRNTSRQGSRYGEARSAHQSPHRGTENVKPDTHQPSVSSIYSNGSATTSDRRLLSSQDVQRPATAGRQGGDGSQTSTPRPKQSSHTRSQSDFQLSPVAPSSPVDFPFPASRDH